jgi:membrane associated rhomboid family serine protease
MNGHYAGRFGNIPPVVKNLIIINVLMLLADYVFKGALGIDLTRVLALYYPGSELFRPYQLVTHMFMHGGLMHLFFNMFALWMFGKILEAVWGSKRFLIYYFVTGLGAASLHLFVQWIEYSGMQEAITAYANTPSVDGFLQFISEHFSRYQSRIQQDPTFNTIVTNWSDNPSSSMLAQRSVQYLNSIVDQLQMIPTVGASGAVFGVLLAFGMLFPNTQLMLLFPPIPIKAKYFVIMYGALELYLGFSQPGSNVAHFAHLGGMLFGFILIKYWNMNRRDFY